MRLSVLLLAGFLGISLGTWRLLQQPQFLQSLVAAISWVEPTIVPTVIPSPTISSTLTLVNSKIELSQTIFLTMTNTPSRTPSQTNIPTITRTPSKTPSQTRTITHTPSITPTPPQYFLPENAIFLGDLIPIVKDIGWGKYSVGKLTFSALEDNLKVGMRISWGSQPFDKGLWAHAPSKITYDLNKDYAKLHTYIFLDPKCNSGGNDDGVVFRILADRQEIFTSPIITDLSTPQEVDVPVNQVKTLTLIVDPGLKNQNGCDWAIWGNPYIVKTR